MSYWDKVASKFLTVFVDWLESDEGLAWLSSMRDRLTPDGAEESEKPDMDYLDWLESDAGLAWLADIRDKLAPDEPVEPEPIPEPTEPETPDRGYYTRFHHTQTDGPDKGQSLVLCRGQEKFDYCTVAGHDLLYHNDGGGRHTYWNMHKWYDADIICYRDGKAYRIKTDKNAHRGMVFGKCR